MYTLCHGIFVLYFCTVAAVIVIAQEDWAHRTVLDSAGKFHLYWTSQENEIRFKVEVATKGWVGFGLSPNGGMAGSDIVMGWVKDGKASFYDCFAEGYNVPAVDVQQDWVLIDASENDSFTIIQFRRPLVSCDPNDRIISNDTLRAIYAYGPDDPASPETVPYHKKNRGTRSIRLLQPSEKKNVKLPDNVQYWDILSDYSIPEDRNTVYWCQMYKSPSLPGKHHIVRVEPVIQKGNEGIVHHIVLYQCLSTPEESTSHINSPGHECYHPNMPPSFIKCASVTSAWGIGGEPLVLPEHAGIPIGEIADDYYLLEIHYDNPSYESGITDKSGLRVYYTSDLRKYDATTLMAGASVHTTVIIPPGQREFIIAGHVNPECFTSNITSEGIKIIAVFLHSHLLGRKIILRHFRGNTELPPISEDMNYDFNFQEYQYFPNEITILPGDHMTVECTYDSSGRNFTSFGGLSTQEEMCLAFILYYPRMDVDQIYSSPSETLIGGLTGFLQLNRNKIVSPDTLSNLNYVDYLETYEWDPAHIKTVQDAMRYSPHKSFCRYSEPRIMLPKLVKYPYNLLPYEKPDLCSVPSSEAKKDEKECGNNSAYEGRIYYFYLPVISASVICTYWMMHRV